MTDVADFATATYGTTWLTADTSAADRRCMGALFMDADIPVLNSTALAIAHLREDEERIGPREITAEVLLDPLMTLKVLAYAGARHRRSQSGDAETIEAALLMTGTTPFFRDFVNLPVIEETLAAYPEIQLGLLRIMARARRAAIFAGDWAAYRQDLDIDVIIEAALLHDAVEMLVWCFAPELALRMVMVRRKNPTMRSRDIQLSVLGVELNELRATLFKAWRLSTLLQRLTSDDHIEHPQVKTVQLATSLARHSANGWDDRALPDDYCGIAALLNVTPEWVIERVCEPTTEPATG